MLLCRIPLSVSESVLTTEMEEACVVCVGAQVADTLGKSFRIQLFRSSVQTPPAQRCQRRAMMLVTWFAALTPSPPSSSSLWLACYYVCVQACKRCVSVVGLLIFEVVQSNV